MKKIKWYWKKFGTTRFGKTLKTYFGLDDAIAFVSLLLGLLYYLFPFDSQFFVDFHSELISIGITVLILGNANQYMTRKVEKQRLVQQMGSTDNGFAFEAARLLKQNGWLSDGTLRNADFIGANLDQAPLDEAFLVEADLSVVNLRFASLSYANLTNSVMESVDLYGAYLNDTNLTGANLSEADATGADFQYACLNNANLSRVHFEGANLECISYNENTIWEGATFTTGEDGTKFPKNFDPIQKGMICVDNNEKPTE